MEKHISHPIYLGNIPSESADRIKALVALEGHPPLSSIEAVSGRLVGMAINSDSNQIPSGLILPDNERFRAFSVGIKPILEDIGTQPPITYWMPDATAAGEFSTEAALIKAMGQGDFANQFDPSVSHIIYPNRGAVMFPDLIEAARAHGLDFVSGVPRYDFNREKSPLNRSGWARDPREPDKPAFPDMYGIPYPPACLAHNRKDLATAYDYVTSANGRPDVFLKRIHGTGGEVYPVSSWEELRSTYERLVAERRLYVNGIEEPVEVQGSVNIVAGLSFQYNEGETVTPSGLTTQLFHRDKPDAWVGNIWNVQIPGIPSEDQERLRAEIRDIAAKVNYGLTNELGEGNVGPGGADIAIVHDDGRLKAMVIELNGGRITGAHPAAAFSKTLGIERQPFLVTKVAGKPATDLKEAYQLLTDNNLHYSPQTRRGVVPLLWLQHTPNVKDSGIGQLFITAPTATELDTISDKSAAVLEEEGHLKA